VKADLASKEKELARARADLASRTTALNANHAEVYRLKQASSQEVDKAKPNWYAPKLILEQPT
jgi:hypothetical protein